MKVSGPSTILSCILVAAIILPGSQALADTKVKGKIYGNWAMSLDDDDDYKNQFKVTRAYVTVKSDINESFATRVTTDIGLIKEYEEDTKLRSFLKYAYLEWKNPLDGLKIRFGAAGTGLVGHHDKFMNRRWVEK